MKNKEDFPFEENTLSKKILNIFAIITLILLFGFNLFLMIGIIYDYTHS